MKWTVTGGQIVVVNEGSITVQAPSSPWAPILVTARSQANTGARAGPIARAARDGFASLVYKTPPGVIVSPVGVCLMPGETKPFTAQVVGEINQAVTWSVVPSGAGFFTDNVYTAQGPAPQVVSVVATSVANTDSKGLATVLIQDKCKAY